MTTERCQPLRRQGHQDDAGKPGHGPSSSCTSAGSILVVIPTLNEVHTIASVVESLCQDLPPGVRWRVVVADGGSSDGTRETVQRMMATRSWLQLLHNPKRIQSAAVNLAARSCGDGARILIRCDAHARYPRGFVRDLLAALERTGADAVVVPMDSTGDNCLQRAVAWVSDTPVGSGGSAHRGGKRSGFVDHGHHAAFRMESFRRAGGYDESFSHNEDAELDCRQRALGSRIYLDAGIRLGYHPRGTWRGLWRQYLSYGRGRARTVRKHPDSLRARQLAVPLHFAISVTALALLPWTALPMLWPAAYGLCLALASTGLALRHRAACGLLAGPAAFVMHGAWAIGFLSGLVLQRDARWHPDLVKPLWADSAALR